MNAATRKSIHVIFSDGLYLLVLAAWLGESSAEIYVIPTGFTHEQYQALVIPEDPESTEEIRAIVEAAGFKRVSTSIDRVLHIVTFIVVGLLDYEGGRAPFDPTAN